MRNPFSDAGLVTTTGTEPARTTYEILVRGDVGARLADSLGARRLEPRPGMTILLVEIIDRSHLHGVLEQLCDLRIEIERVNPV